jgi:hypothetical protein
MVDGKLTQGLLNIKRDAPPKVGNTYRLGPSKTCYCWRDERSVVTMAVVTRERASSVAKILLHPFQNMDHFYGSL